MASVPWQVQAAERECLDSQVTIAAKERLVTCTCSKLQGPKGPFNTL